jgi:2-haloacid dehalogenase
MENYLHLDPYPEIRGALAALKGRKLAILSSGSRRMLQKLVQNSGLDRWIEVVISIDSVRTYQPHRSCYALVEPVIGLSKEEVLFVLSNSFDLVGAKAFFKVASIDRPSHDVRHATRSRRRTRPRSRPYRLGIDRAAEAALTVGLH